MTAIHFHSVDSADHLVRPKEYWDLTPRSPAIELLTDFRRHEPQVIDGATSAVDAERFLRQAHNKMRLVVDAHGEFIGLVTLNHLAETRLVRRVAAGEPRTDILVSDVMIPRRDVKALSYGELETATVGDIVESLRCSGQQHCLVVDDDEHSIRGLIAASDVAERLHRRISVKPEPSFADIFSALRH